MIDLISGVKQAAEPPAPLPPHGGSAAPGLPKVKPADPQKQVAPSDPVLDVRLDGGTMRLYTEMRNPVTNRVLFRLPAVYQGGNKDVEAGASFQT
jgi:hypothetical protein